MVHSDPFVLSLVLARSICFPIFSVLAQFVVTKCTVGVVSVGLCVVLVEQHESDRSAFHAYLVFVVILP